MEHRFYEGVSVISGGYPSREWTIVAPKYFKSTPDYTGVIEGYCGPACALARMGT
jgi:hypothetical protein